MDLIFHSCICMITYGVSIRLFYLQTGCTVFFLLFRIHEFVVDDLYLAMNLCDNHYGSCLLYVELMVKSSCMAIKFMSVD